MACVSRSILCGLFPSTRKVPGTECCTGLHGERCDPLSHLAGPDHPPDEENCANDSPVVIAVKSVLGLGANFHCFMERSFQYFDFLQDTPSQA